jgi:hypothetical protein
MKRPVSKNRPGLRQRTKTQSSDWLSPTQKMVADHAVESWQLSYFVASIIINGLILVVAFSAIRFCCVRNGGNVRGS